jgi:DNA-binding MarR family transcriptional regulator
MASGSAKKTAPGPPNVQELREVDRIIHEPSRLAIVAVLSACESADFRYLRTATHLTDGNLSAHLGKLEEAGYLTSEKRFVDKKPNTLYRLNEAGRAAFQQYRKQVGKLMG